VVPGAAFHVRHPSPPSGNAAGSGALSPAQAEVTGAPLIQYVYFNGFYGAFLQLVPRGSAGRLPMVWESNLTLEYPIRIGPVTATLQAYVYHLFNNQIQNSQDITWNDQQQDGYPNTIYDPNQPSTNGNYGLITERQTPRLFRAALRVSF
jgi:hypothetical protein